ncbi:MAG: 2-hydroxyglutaryl-CoA dehydratase [Candidatus Hydrogenedentota bacterium]|nr:MAG: 2-hydroxyglutaryl-CoA dehydratase [Candidatus Hydrogenedentota bacterium]
MIYAGCDLGTVAAKVVIVENGSLLAHEMLAYKNLPKQAAAAAMENVLSRANLSREKIEYCMATGFGKKVVPYANGNIPEIVCLNRAVRWLNPDVRTVIDVGGQSIRAFNIGINGRVTDSSINEKCAAGTGKFIEVMAKALELPLEELGDLPLQARAPVSITSQCGVFAESEVITYVNEGKDRADIVAGISRSVAGKTASLVRRISLDEPVTMVGGVAKNASVVRDLEEELGLKLVELDVDPQIVGALGAALVASEKSRPSA